MSAVLERSVRKLDAGSEKIVTRFSEGSLIFRRWRGPRDKAESVLLIHGGSGSWTHWFRNIDYLRQHFHVLTVDLPGLGESAALPSGYRAEDAIKVMSEGFKNLVDMGTINGKIHVVGFSWGCAVASQVVRLNEKSVKSLMLLGPASIGDIPRRGLAQPLIKRTPEMNSSEVAAANKENLARLMFFDKRNIDEMAVYLQTINTNRSRFNSPQFAKSTLVLDGIGALSIPVKVIYGEYDEPAQPDVAGKKALFLDVNKNVEFDLIPDAGHWLQYEQYNLFNIQCQEWIERHAQDIRNINL
ncbi:MAG: alpha/beta hydrolase [Pseudomonadales bacterium]|jgi:pimeloyl-ACP methyl ester carboxylesterase